MTKPITAEHYREATGRFVVDDELDRANCERAGQLGHTMCGWCHKHDLPNSICATNPATGECLASDEFVAALKTERGVE
jgi:hypothetical protein